MTASLLSAGPVFGVISSSGASDVFQSAPGPTFNLITAPSPAAKSGSTLRMMRSTDGGTTWVQAATIPTNVVSTLAISDTATCLYYLDCTLSAGSFVFIAGCFYGPELGFFQSLMDTTPGLVDVADTSPYPSKLTTAQTVTLFQSRATPLQASDFTGANAGSLTLYKRCRKGAFVTLQVLPNALKDFDDTLPNGTNRTVRVSTATVMAIQNAAGDALASAQGLLDATMIYNVGQTVTAQEFLGSYVAAPPTGYNPGHAPITNFHARDVGLHGFTTQLEAATFLNFGLTA